MLGMALGAFTQGLSQGIDMRGRLDESRDRSQLRSGLKKASTEGQAEYEQKVAAGEEKPGDWQTAYTDYVVPRIGKEYLAAGQPDKAAAWAEWAETANAKKGSKLFANGLSKIQTGDIQGGIDAMVKASNLSGYGPDGKVTAAEYYDEAAGAVTGYRFTFEGADGKPQSKNVATEDVAQFLAGIANPQSAFELEQSSRAARSKADLDVETHGRKKKVEAELGVGGGALTQAQYQNAIQEERKRIEDSALTDKEVGGMSNDQKEQLARDIVDKRFGKQSATSSGPTVTVDPTTGEPVDTGAAQTPATDAAQPPPPTEPTDEELGVDTEVPTSSVAPAAPPNGISAPTPAAQTGVSANQQQAYLDHATQLLKQGANPQQISQALTSVGIPPERWPQDLQLAARQAQLGIQGR